MDKTVDYLSTYASSLQYEDLPPEVVHQCKRMIVDTMGCAIGGYPSQPATIARDLAGTLTSSQPATILGSGQKTSVDMAAFANGVMIRYLDYNDGYTGKEVSHPSDTLAAILSPGEVTHQNGKTIIAATVLSYEVFCHLCDAVSMHDQGFDHVTLGVVASVLGAAKALGLSREQMAQAVNLAVVANSALFQTRIGEVSMWKGCAFANASRNAVFAALLASRGLIGPSPIYEGLAGFFNAVARESFELLSFGGDGNPFKIMESSIKRFPLGLYSQTVVQAALEAAQKLPNIENIQEVNVKTLGTALRIMAGDEEKWHPTTRETADHSMPYTVGVALMYGTVEEHHFDDEFLNNPKLLELVQKVRTSIWDEADRREPEAMLCNVEIITTEGQRFSSEVAHHRGHWKNPMTDQEIEAKFRSITRDLQSPSQMDTLLDRIWHLEEMEDIGQLAQMVKIEG